MATLARSSRRIDGLHHHHANPNTHLIATSAARNAQNIFPRGPAGREKRSRDAADCDFDALSRKRPRIAVEIIPPATSAASKPVAPAQVASPQRSQQQAQHENTRQLQHPPPNTPPKSPPNATAANAPIESERRAATATSDQSAPPPQEANSNPTRHQSKVKSGILHELDRLEPSAAEAQPQGRKLRSQETSRFKSDLSAYFPEYDEIIGNKQPKEKHILNVDTPIVILDTPTSSNTESYTTPSTSHDANLQKANTGTGGQAVPRTSDGEFHTSQQPTFSLRYYGDALFDELYDTQRIDFGFLETRYKGKSLDDPLPDSYFEPAHKKAERHEKLARNHEKARAQHERDRIIRILDELQGHDWLRVMGVSGITETRKKSFEPARDHFIRGCEAILAKFRRWSQEEKRRKQEKDRAASELAHGKESAAESGSSDDHGSSSHSTPHGGDEDAASHRDDGSTVSEPVSDVDASIEKQLHEEVLARSRMASDPPVADSAAASSSTSALNAKAKAKEGGDKQGAKGRAKPAPKATKRKEPEPEMEKEFKSFFAKRHERDAALKSNRRTNRKVLAWGHPIPDIPEADYEPPENVIDAETVKTLERKRRRDRRGGKS